LSAQTWFERHAQTLVGSLGRLVQTPLATAMTMAVIAVALVLPLLLTVLLMNLRAATDHWNQAIDISVYMKKTAPPGRSQTVAQALRARADVSAVQFIGADQALAQFRSVSGFGTALDALNDNPLPDTLVVTPTLAASTPAAMQALQKDIAAMADVQTVQVDTQWVTRLQSMMDVLRRVLWLLGALLGLGVMLVIGNTIRLDILNRRAEIEVMKLVGASDGFARRPFLYSGVWYGLGGGLLALILCAVGIGLLTRPVERLAGLYGSQFHLEGVGFTRGAAVLAFAVVLGWVGSWLAATRHIRGIAPT